MRAGDLARAEQELLGLVVAGELDGDDGARSRRWSTVVGAVADPRLAQQVGQLADAGLLLALLVLGGVVAAVLLEVALFAAGVDLRGHRRAAGHQLVELGLQPVVGFLGQPDALVLLVSGGGHEGVLLRLGWPSPDGERRWSIRPS